ncbi:MAG TPA: hypothetical protein VGF67_00510 [Ktedonobacteraceae bacterium]
MEKGIAQRRAAGGRHTDIRQVVLQGQAGQHSAQQAALIVGARTKRKKMGNHRLPAPLRNQSGDDAALALPCLPGNGQIPPGCLERLDLRLDLSQFLCPANEAMHVIIKQRGLIGEHVPERWHFRSIRRRLTRQQREKLRTERVCYICERSLPISTVCDRNATGGKGLQIGKRRMLEIDLA